MICREYLGGGLTCDDVAVTDSDYCEAHQPTGMSDTDEDDE